MSHMLDKARQYEKEAEEQIAKSIRPLFHLSARAGWMNDPNGFSFFDGAYHLYYQYYPYSSQWNSMHWGHASSPDLLHWEYQPAALAPDMHYDKDGCFSGSSIGLPDGRRLIMYTGVYREDSAPGNISSVEYQTQCLAIGDGTDFRKYRKNPVISADQLPAWGSVSDFRDPHIYQRPDGTYYCVVGNRTTDGDSQILLYNSPDALEWEYEGVLASNKGRFGRMWECPDFFELDGKQVLLISPQDMLPRGLEYHNGNGTLCLIGSFDEEKGVFNEQYNQAVDYGIDFYAPQTVLAPDGRRIIIGWMQNPDACSIREPESPWAGQMSLPRELSIVDGRLYQKPLSELSTLYGREITYENVPIYASDSGSLHLDGIHGRTLDLDIRVRPSLPGSTFGVFGIHLAEGEQFYTTIQYRFKEHTMKIDREFSGSRRAIVHQRKCRLDGKPDGELRFRLILDRYSVEVFLQDGRKVMTSAIYTDQKADGVSFYSDGDVLMDVTCHEITLI